MAVTIKQVQAIADKIRDNIETLELLRDAKQEVLDNAENADYPNEERIDTLTQQVDALTEAIEAMEQAMELLEGYE